MAAPTIQDFANALEVSGDVGTVKLMHKGNELDWTVAVGSTAQTLFALAADKLGTTPGSVRVYLPGEQVLKKNDVLQAGTYRINLRTFPTKFSSNAEYRQSLRAAKEANRQQTEELGKMITEAKNQGVQEVKHLLDDLEERLVTTNVTCTNAVLDEVWKEGQMCRDKTHQTAKVAVAQTMRVQSEIEDKKPIGDSPTEKLEYAGRKVWEWQKQVHDFKCLRRREACLKKLKKLADKTDKHGYVNFPDRTVYPKPTAGQQTLAPQAKNEKEKKKAVPKLASAPPAKKAKKEEKADQKQTSLTPTSSAASSAVVPRLVSVHVVPDDGNSESGTYKIKPTTPLSVVKKAWCEENYLNVEDVTLRWSNTDLHDAATLTSFRELNLQDVVKIQAVVTI